MTVRRKKGCLRVSLANHAHVLLSFAAEQRLWCRREAEQASSQVWGPPPPPQVPAMLRGRLALRVLGGVEGNTLVAQVNVHSDML